MGRGGLGSRRLLRGLVGRALRVALEGETSGRRWRSLTLYGAEPFEGGFGVFGEGGAGGSGGEFLEELAGFGGGDALEGLDGAGFTDAAAGR